MLSTEQRKVLDLAMAAIDRSYGKGSVIRLGNKDIEPWPSISTGALTLDIALGIGGLPLGRIVEIYGAEGSSKSTLALSVVAQAQKQGLGVAYIDAEHALDPTYMKALDVDLDDLILSQPDSGEQALQIAEKLIKTGAISVLVVDSVAALTPQAQLDGEIGDNHMMLLARLMSQALSTLKGSIAAANCCVVFVNQVREKPTMYGNPITQPGGRALKFYSSVRLETRQSEALTDKNGLPSGIKVKVKVVKNKMAPALRIAEYDVLYGKGIDVFGCVIDAAITKSVITKGGAWYDVLSTKVHGREGVVDLLVNNLDMFDLIKDEVLKNV